MPLLGPSTSAATDQAAPRVRGRSRLAIILATLVVLAALACNGSSDGRESATSTPAAIDLKPSAQPGPGQSADGQVADEPVAFRTSDGITVRGHLYSSAGPKRRIVIFAHDFPRDQIAWTAFARELAAQGTASLTFDFRGYGETGGAKDVPKVHLDLEAALGFIESRDYPLIYVVGASFGGTAALKVAARNDFAGVIAVSAPTNFRGLDARQDVAKVGEPKLFIASRGDGDAPKAVSFFLDTAPPPKASQLFDGNAHGTELLQGGNAAAFKQAILDFVGR